MKWSILLVSFVISGCTTTATQEITNKVAADGDRLICYRQNIVGSHFTRKVCKTRRQIEDDRKAAVDLLDRSRLHDATQISGEQ